MKVWLTSIAFFFILFELFQWIKGFILPLPIYVLAGAFLAIASNYNKGIVQFLPKIPPNPPISQTATLEDSPEPETSKSSPS
jgi:hypothetical protein